MSRLNWTIKAYACSRARLWFGSLILALSGPVHSVYGVTSYHTLENCRLLNQVEIGDCSIMVQVITQG